MGGVARSGPLNTYRPGSYETQTFLYELFMTAEYKIRATAIERHRYQAGVVYVSSHRLFLMLYLLADKSVFVV